MQRLTEYYEGEARVTRIGHKIAYAKLAAYEDTELSPEDVTELKLELIAARSRLVDVEKALELAGECLQEELCVDCPLDIDDFDCETLGFDCDMNCWKEYFIWKARGCHVD